MFPDSFPDQFEMVTRSHTSTYSVTGGFITKDYTAGASVALHRRATASPLRAELHRRRESHRTCPAFDA